MISIHYYIAAYKNLNYYYIYINLYKILFVKLLELRIGGKLKTLKKPFNDIYLFARFLQDG